MANKSGVAAQILALPKGGGAVEGIGETFHPDPLTGTGNFTIPIQVPPGRGGFQPELSLTYSTGAGNGPFGLGWQVSIPHVSRKVTSHIPRYRDMARDVAERDAFIMGGVEDLVLVGERRVGAEVRRTFRPRTEGPFSRIEHVIDGDTDHWELRTRAGVRSVFGATDASRVRDGADPSRVFSWLLSWTEDTHGNRIVYSYKRDDGRDANGRSLAAHGNWFEEQRSYNQVYPSEIRWAEYRSAAAVDDYLYSVAFDYGDRGDDGEVTGQWDYRADDPFSSYRAGFEIRTVRRCRRIVVRLREDGQSDRAIRSYEFDYEQSGRNRLSLLRSVTLVGAAPREPGDSTGDLLPDGGTVEITRRVSRMPPLDFDYTRMEPERRQLRDLSAASPYPPDRQLGNPDFELLDMDGVGLPGVLELSRTGQRYWRNRGGRFDPPHPLHRGPHGVTLADPGVQLADVDGDGRSDLIVSNGRLSGYYSTGFEQRWDPRSFRAFDVAPAFGLTDPNTRLVDMNGDGKVDLLHTTPDEFQIQYANGNGGFSRTVEHVPRGDPAEFPEVAFADRSGRTRLASLSGSGQDVVRLHDGHIDYWPHYGYGRYGRRITMRETPRIGAGYDPSHVILADVDGDGFDDWIFVGHSSLTVSFNRSGNAWSAPVIIHGTPPLGDPDSVRAVDMLGNGVAGLLWSFDNDQRPRRNYQFLDLTGGTKPYLLVSAANNLGASTSVTYRPSTWFWSRDLEDGLEWKTTLPFPVQCVAEVRTVDEFAGTVETHEFRYHHGHWSGRERKFVGFGRVEELDARPPAGVAVAPASAAVEKRTWFHLGDLDDNSEADFTREYWGGDPQRLGRPATFDTLLGRLPPQSRRDVLRAMRGMELRTELYARDGGERADLPFGVSENLISVREEKTPGAETKRARIFFPHRLASRTTAWDRGSDPMHTISYMGGYDAYGQHTWEVKLGVPRGRDPWVAGAPGNPFLVSLELIRRAQRDDTAVFLVDRIASRTIYEVPNDGSQAVGDLLKSCLSGALPRRPVSQTLNYYDGAAFTGLPIAQVGSRGALVRSERLAMTPALLHEVYRSGAAVRSPPEQPPYLDPNAAPATWTPEYPAAFRASMDPLGGYMFDRGTGSWRLRGYYAVDESRSYDFQTTGSGRGLTLVRRDGLGGELALGYDRYGLLVSAITDSLGHLTASVPNHRVQLPAEIADPNGNRKRFRYTPLGLLASSATMGKQGEAAGDTDAEPGVHYAYDLHAFKQRGEPISIFTTRRVYHATDSDVTAGRRNDTIDTIEYSDGLGRLIQTRSTAADLLFADGAGLDPDQTVAPGDAAGTPPAAGDPPRVVVSGTVIYDQKSRVAERYEPYLSTGWAYAQPRLGQLGVSTRYEYDARNRVVRTLFPDGSEQRTVHGVPADLTDPDDHAPSPWEAYTYDGNDNAGRTHGESGPVAAAQWNTPTSATLDQLGRTATTTYHMGDGRTLTTRYGYDAASNVVSVLDPLGRTAERHLYDCLGRLLRSDELDAGCRRAIYDPLGGVLEERDDRGALKLAAYDKLHRPIRVWARDAEAETVTLRERIAYGGTPDSGIGTADAVQRNLLGRVYAHYDEAGLLTFPGYSFKGDVVRRIRRAVADSAVTSVFAPKPPNWAVRTYRVDWQPPPGVTVAAHANATLDSTGHETSIRYDALGRRRWVRCPRDVNGERKLLQVRHGPHGGIEQIDLGGTRLVDRVAYNALGQPILVAYGNGIITRAAYDPVTKRLARRRSERARKPSAHTYRPTGSVLDDSGYDYDLVGNLVGLHARSPGCGLPQAPAELDRAFELDPLYRLTAATGRECELNTSRPLWDLGPRCAAVSQARAYRETYAYDDAGNMLELRHRAGTSAWTRRYELVPGTNRLASLQRGSTTYAYTYDAVGNLVDETSSRHFEWDHAGRLRAFRTQTEGGAEPSLHATYLYDATGELVKKVVRRQGGGLEVTTYIDKVFERTRIVQPGDVEERDVIHVHSGAERVATLRVGTPAAGDRTPALKYELTDHLGSVTALLRADGGVLTRDEMTPWGETAFAGATLRRYGLTGVESHAESGLSRHGRRHYSPWLGRWTSPDPLGSVDTLNLYCYARNSPLQARDRKGTQTEDEGISFKWLEATIDHILARVKGGAHVDPANLGFLSRSDNSSKGARPEGLRTSHPTQSLAEALKAGNFNQAAQQMIAGRFSETAELRDLWEKASKGQTLSYETSQQNFWNLVQEAGDADSKLVKQALEAGGIKFNATIGRFAIDPKATGLTSKYTLEQAKEMLSKWRASAKSAGGAALDTLGGLAEGLKKAGNVAGKLAVVGDVLEAWEMAEHMENRTLPGFMGLWLWVTPESRNLDYPDGTPVHDPGGRVVGHVYGGSIHTVW